MPAELPENIRTNEGKFSSGVSGNPSGRPKGIPNKSTQLLKDAILLAARKAGGDDDEGLVNYLQTQATENPGPFLSLLGKVLPLTLTNDGEEGFKITITTGVPRETD